MTTSTIGVEPEASPGGRAALRSGWPAFLANRLVGLVLSLAVLVVATFLIVPLIPGDPAIAILGTQATKASIAALHLRLHLDDPLPVRFAAYLGGLAHLDLGTSFRYGTPVGTVIATKLPYTLSLAGYAIVLVLVVSVPLGMLVGVLTRGGRRRGLAVGFGAIAGLFASVPMYVAGTLLIVVFAITLKLLPAGGVTSQTSAILPVLALALGPTFAMARVVRQETQELVALDYMRTARGHRLPAARLYLQHALPNLLTSTLTLAGIILAGIIGGTVVVESVFAFPGIGQEVVQAIIYKDYPVVQGIVLVIGSMAIAVNLVIDLILAVVDPRLRSAAHA
jgi:peptide/nickel transport system permease protein